MDKLELRIISAEQILYNGTVSSVRLPGVEGDFSILPKHAPLIAALTKGKIIYHELGGESHEFEVLAGFVEIKKNLISVCVEQ